MSKKPSEIKTSSEFLPKYPLYIISKGRYETNKTARLLERLGVPYKVAVESHETKLYANALGEEKIIELPWSNHGKGSGPARNYVWEHSIKAGFARHHVIDDNIDHVYRFHHNRRHQLKSGSLIRAMEDFVDRYENVGLAGPQYKFFAHDASIKRPVVLNQRVMSWCLIDNTLPFRWRCKYNEDVDLYLRIMKSGYWCTMLFYFMLQLKMKTQTMKGGNTDELYGVGTYDKSKMLYQLHPDVVRMVERYGRDHHAIDIKPFQHIMPILKKDIVLPTGVNEYGLCFSEGYGTEYFRKAVHRER